MLPSKPMIGLPRIQFALRAYDVITAKGKTDNP